MASDPLIQSASTPEAAAALDAPISNMGIMAAVAMGAMAGIMPSLQPLLLAGLAAEGRLDVQAIGHVATIEALSMALAVGLAGVFLQPNRLRPLLAVTLLAGAAMNLGTGQATSLPLIMLFRAGVGLSSGLLLWVLIGLLARVNLPARVTGLYVVTQGVAAVVISALLSAIIIPRLGVDYGYAALALLGVALIPLGLRAPARLAALGGARFALPNKIGSVGLLAAMAHLAAIMALWVYIVPVAVLHGFSHATTGTVISVALAAQIGAGIAAMRFAALPPKTTVLLCALGSLGAVALLSIPGSLIIFAAGMLIFSICWVFALPYFVPFLIDLDPSKRSVMLLTCVQLIGVAAGPSLSASAICLESALVALPVSAALFGMTILLILISTKMMRW